MSFYSIVDYTANGSTVNYAVSFPYLIKDHVEVYVDGVLKAVTTDYTWSNAGQITFNSAPTTGLAIRIKRNTPKTVPQVDFTNGSKLTATDLDTVVLQLLYIDQEAIDYTADSLANAIPGTLPVPANPGDDSKILTAMSGAAVWKNTASLVSATVTGLSVIGASTFGGTLRPVTSGVPDLGSSSKKFRDLYLSGSLNIGGNAQETITVVTAVKWDSAGGTLQIKTRTIAVVPTAAESGWADITAEYADLVV